MEILPGLIYQEQREYKMTSKFTDAEKEGYNVKPKRVFSEEHLKQISRAGCLLSEETKKKICLALKGRKRSEETKKKISLAKKGKPNGRLGHTHSKETRKKLSLRLKGNTNALKKA